MAKTKKSKTGSHPHPGKILAENFMKSMNISRKKLAEDIHVPSTAISAVIKGTEAISADLSLRLGKYFGNGPDFWMKLELDFAAERIKEELNAIPRLSNVPEVASPQGADRKTMQRKKNLEKVRKEWLEKNKDEYRIKEAFKTLQSADLSHPTDAMAESAVVVGDMKTIRELANAGFKRWCKEDIGWEAFRTPCLDVVEFIVENGYDVNLCGEWGPRGKTTPLCVAAECGYADIVRYLLSVGADAKFESPRGYTPLHFAASSHSLETVKLLVEAGTDVNAWTVPNRMRTYEPDAMSALLLMASDGFCDGMKYLVAHGAKLHHKKPAQFLLHAVCDSWVRSDKIRETAEYLLDAGFDPFQLDSHGQSAVYYAAGRNNIDALRALINRGIPLDRPDAGKWYYRGLLPLEIAALNQDTDEDAMLEVLNLISEHSLPFAETHVLNCAVSTGWKPRARVCKYLLEKGCPVNGEWRPVSGDPACSTFVSDSDYFSPLHAIASCGNHKRTEITALLIAAGADVNQKDPNGNTPLAKIAERAYKYNESLELITMLHEAGADFNAKNNNGRTVLQRAKNNNADKAALELLKKYGAK